MKIWIPILMLILIEMAWPVEMEVADCGYCVKKLDQKSYFIYTHDCEPIEDSCVLKCIGATLYKICETPADDPDVGFEKLFKDAFEILFEGASEGDTLFIIYCNKNLIYWETPKSLADLIWVDSNQRKYPYKDGWRIHLVTGEIFNINDTLGDENE